MGISGGRCKQNPLQFYTTMDFGELKHDVNFVTRVTDFDHSLEELQEHVKRGLEVDVTKLAKEDRIKHELFLAYCINTLYYLYLKINGTNVNEHPIKNELSRIRQAMLREKQLEERVLRPKVNVPVAGRFIKHELWDPNAKKDDVQRRK